MAEFPDTRETLLFSLKADESGSWMEFMAIYESVIYRVATGKGLQHADALDVTQEVLAKVYRKIGEWNTKRGDGRFRNWLHRLTVNASIDVIRKRKRQAIASGDSGIHELLGQLPAASEDESTLFQLEFKRVLFHHAAERVKADTKEIAWQVFWMTSVEGISPGDVATEFGLTLGAVYAHKCRVLSKIRAQLQRIDSSASTVNEDSA